METAESAFGSVLVGVCRIPSFSYQDVEFVTFHTRREFYTLRVPWHSGWRVWFSGGGR